MDSTIVRSSAAISSGLSHGPLRLAEQSVADQRERDGRRLVLGQQSQRAEGGEEPERASAVEGGQRDGRHDPSAETVVSAHRTMASSRARPQRPYLALRAANRAGFCQVDGVARSRLRPSSRRLSP